MNYYFFLKSSKEGHDEKEKGPKKDMVVGGISGSDS